MKTFSPIRKDYEVPNPPSKPTEFEIHAWLYSELKKSGADVRGEVTWRGNLAGERINCRFDLVIYSGGRAERLIEVKNGAETDAERTRQGRRYRLFGVPVTFVYGMADAEKFANLYAVGRDA